MVIYVRLLYFIQLDKQTLPYEHNDELGYLLSWGIWLSYNFVSTCVTGYFNTARMPSALYVKQIAGFTCSNTAQFFPSLEQTQFGFPLPLSADGSNICLVNICQLVIYSTDQWRKVHPCHAVGPLSSQVFFQMLVVVFFSLYHMCYCYHTIAVVVVHLWKFVDVLCYTGYV